MQDKKDVVEELPCELTGEEMLERSSRLAGLHQQQMEVEDKKKTATNEFNARVKKISGEIHYLSNVISSGKESRNVKCLLDYYWTEGKKILTRLDTGEVVEESIISDFERQQHMDFVKRENEKGGKKTEVEYNGPTEPDRCFECGSERGTEHAPKCPHIEEAEKDEVPVDSESETEGVEEVPGGAAVESEEGVGQEESGDEVPKENLDQECFGTFEADNESCQGCGEAEKCFDATPEEVGSSDDSPPDEVSEEEALEEESIKEDDQNDTPKKYQCSKCEEHFDEPGESDEEDSSCCPHCQSKDWF